MIKTLKSNSRLNETIYLGTLTILCFIFSMFRLAITGTNVFLFLNWNLFLAFIPWLLTSIVVVKFKTKINKVVLTGLLLAWLLFFPNAPYILTDLFHLRLKSSMPIWFDLVLILSFAWTGLLFGLLSLMDIENILSKLISKVWVRLFVFLLLFVGSFGIYVGRYLRWNSWDIITEPFNLYYDISDRIINPFDHPRTWGLSIFMGVFLNMIYWSFRMINEKKV